LITEQATLMLKIIKSTIGEVEELMVKEMGSIKLMIYKLNGVNNCILGAVLIPINEND
jgi:hypothetical protein